MGGNRRRSSSESEANDFAINSMSPNGPLGGLNFPSGLKLTQGGSYPNLSGSDMGFISTPITEGANTRLGARRLVSDVHNRVEDELKNLQTQIDQWMLLISSDRQTDKDDIDHVANNFIARINNLAQGCLRKKVDFKIHADVLQLLPIIKKARRTHLRISGIPDDVAYEDSQDDILKRNASHEPTIEPEKEKNPNPMSDELENHQFQDDVEEIVARTKLLKQQQALANTRATKDVSDESMFNGFNTVIDEIEEIKRIMELNKKATELKSWNQEKKLVTMRSEMKKLESSVTIMATNLQDIGSVVDSNTVRIGRLEEKQYNLGLTVKGIEKKVLKRVSELVEWMEENEINQSTPIRDSSNGENLLTVRNEVKELKDSISEEKRKMSDIKGSVKMVGDKLDETISGLSSMSTVRLTDNPNLGGGPGVEQTRNIIKLGIQRHVLQISQLIGVRLDTDNPDLKLIKNVTTLMFPRFLKLSPVAEMPWRNM